MALGWLGAAHVEAGAAEQAIPLLEDAIGQLQELSGAGGYRYRQLDGQLRALLSEAFLTKGDLARAQALGANALSIAAAGGWPVAIGYAARAVGRIALAAGKPDEADAAARQALRTFAECEALAQLARSRLGLAEILAVRGERSAAGSELSAAREAFVQMRVPRLVERTERLAKALGLPFG